VTEGLVIPKPRRNAWWFVGLYLLAPLGAVIAKLQAPDTPNAVVVAVLLVWTVFFAGLLWYARRQSTWLVGTRLIVRGVHTRAVDLSTAPRIRLIPDSTGNAVVTAKGDGASVYVRVLTINAYHTYAQSPEVCRALADAVRRNPLPEAPPIAALLDAQAEHLGRGGNPGDSPLKPYTSDALLRAAGVAGVAGALGSLEG
jgi:hypothetical protein